MTKKVQTAEAPAGAKPDQVAVPPDAQPLADLQVVNDIAVAEPAADVAEPAQPPVSAETEPVAWPREITVRNDSRVDIVCPLSGMFLRPATQCAVLLHDADHAAAVIRNIRDLAALQNASAEIVITGLDGLVI